MFEAQGKYCAFYKCFKCKVNLTQYSVFVKSFNGKQEKQVLPKLTRNVNQPKDWRTKHRK